MPEVVWMTGHLQLENPDDLWNLPLASCCTHASGLAGSKYIPATILTRAWAYACSPRNSMPWTARTARTLTHGGATHTGLAPPAVRRTHVDRHAAVVR